MTNLDHWVTNGKLACDRTRGIDDITKSQQDQLSGLSRSVVRERWTTEPKEATCIPCRKAAGLPPGSKHDRGKRRYDLVPTVAEELVVEVLTYGADKYGVENWRSLDDWERRFYAATRRHLAAWLRGEKLDPESGLPHLAHATTNALLMLELDQAKTVPVVSVGGNVEGTVGVKLCPGCKHKEHRGPGSCLLTCPCEGGRA